MATSPGKSTAKIHQEFFQAGYKFVTRLGFLLSLLNMICTITIDGREIKAKSGANLLWTALDNGINIPNLCSLRDIARPPASCRLCYVEITGRDNPVTSCTETVLDGMSVTTNNPQIYRLRKFSFELLMSRHTIDCGHCIKNRKCELQQIARSQHFPVLGKRFNRLATDFAIDNSHPLIIFDPNKCVLCGRCVHVCQSHGNGVLDFAHRGINTSVSTFSGIPLAESNCNACLSCTEVCPTGALYEK